MSPAHLWSRVPPCLQHATCHLLLHDIVHVSNRTCNMHVTTCTRPFGVVNKCHTHGCWPGIQSMRPEHGSNKTPAYGIFDIQVDEQIAPMLMFNIIIIIYRRVAVPPSIVDCVSVFLSLVGLVLRVIRGFTIHRLHTARPFRISTGIFENFRSPSDSNPASAQHQPSNSTGDTSMSSTSTKQREGNTNSPFRDKYDNSNQPESESDSDTSTSRSSL